MLLATGHITIPGPLRYLFYRSLAALWRFSSTGPPWHLVVVLVGAVAIAGGAVAVVRPSPDRRGRRASGGMATDATGRLEIDRLLEERRAAVPHRDDPDGGT